jgi:nicotinate-nucleotide adenylyltransferase
MKRKRIALFGGTFDPIHLGHTVVTAAAADCIGAHKVIFIPAKRSPLKGRLPEASDGHRLNMIRLAIKQDHRFELSDFELDKAEPSYTIDTVRHFRAAYGDEAAIYWLVGADSIADLPQWYRITDLIDDYNLAVMFRAGCSRPDFTEFENLWGRARVEKLQRNVIPTPLIDISSTEIRHRLATGQDVSDMLAPEVADYIEKHHPYEPRP